MSIDHGRRQLVSKIQDGSQLTGSTNMSEAMIHITNGEPTAWQTQEVYLSSSSNDRQSEMAAETVYFWFRPKS